MSSTDAILSEMLLKESSKAFGIKPEDLKLQAGGFQNSVYSFIRNNREYVLRLTHSTRRDLNLIKGELDFVNHLSNSGVSVSRAIPSVNDHYAEQISIGQDTYYATSFEKAKGRPVDVSDDQEWNRDFFQRWGKLLGKMHATAKKYEAPDLAIKRPEWSKNNPDIHNIKNHMPSEMIANKYSELLTALTTLDRHDDLFGLIHNDFHQGNFFVHDSQITVFDFDDSAYYWFASDIAVSFYHAYWQGTSVHPNRKDFSEQFMKSFLEGYSKENNITKEMVSQIPLFLKMREIFLYVLFLRNWDPNHLQDWQRATLQNLKFNIENDVPYSDLDFHKII
ncbi:phosphotransferase [Paenibacillus sediminis]|uniref:Ser/Thr protein kinase RdoA (MazF antagonist) n=1 Tax=Paenibacillus sediminis TaxID=664909 RepID=A0ABS4H8Q1_9BACL|nr:phosphotransferase [Paenibacillus sediminis]MBP1938647.1 Ser/Thr protein kinase RdoA (MazF antagonist) [Paenibacillus sediminis]